MSETITPKADQFAFAVALFESITGFRPFHGQSPLELMANIAANARKPWPEDSKAPLGLRAAIDRALSTSKEDRFLSMTAFLDACRLGLGLGGQLKYLTQRWLDHGRDPNFYLTGKLLAEGISALRDDPYSFASDQVALIISSAQARRKRVLRRGFLIGGITGLTALLVPTTWFLWHRNTELKAVTREEVLAHLLSVQSGISMWLSQAERHLSMMAAQAQAWWPTARPLTEIDPDRSAASLDDSTETRSAQVIALNNYFRAFVEQVPVISSLRLWAEDGFEYLIFEDRDAQNFEQPYRFYNRLSYPAFEDGRIVELFTPDDDTEPRSRVLLPGQLDSRGRTFAGYFPKKRPAYARAFEAEDGKITWTKPYVFFVTQDVGVTGSIPLQMNQRRYVVSVDFMLTDISALTTRIHDSSVHATVVSGDGRVVALPADPRRKTPDDARAFFKHHSQADGQKADAEASLPELSSLGIQELTAAYQSRPREGGTYEVQLEDATLQAGWTPVGPAALDLHILVVQKRKRSD